MNVSSKLSGHWTDDSLIAHLYGVGPDDGHLQACAECQSRLSAMQERRQALTSEQLEPEWLAAQRRRIYARLTQASSGLWRGHVVRWASAGAAALVLSGSLVYYQQQRDRDRAAANMLSDAELAQDVSRLSENPEARPTAPLQALFEE